MNKKSLPAFASAAPLALAIVLGSGLAHGQWTTPPSASPLVQQHTFESAAAGETVSYHILLPPGYAEEPERRYPVIYWLHGANAVLAGMGSLSQWYLNRMSEGLLPPALVVFPNGMPYGMWTNSKDGLVPMETVVISELMPEIDAKFRTIPNRSGRLLEGFSMGGYGAARLGFAHPTLFGGVSMLGAAALQLEFLDSPPESAIPPEVYLEIYENVWGSDPEYFLAQGPRALAEANLNAILATGLRLRQAVGQQDHVAPTNLDFRDFLETLGVPFDFFFPPAIGHQQIALLNLLALVDPGFYTEQFAPLIPGRGQIQSVPGCSALGAVLSACSVTAAIGQTLGLKILMPNQPDGLAQVYFGTLSIDANGCGIVLPGLGELLLGGGSEPTLLATAPIIAGTAELALSVAFQPAWIGLEVALQSLTLAPATTGLELSLSNALAVRIGQ